MFLIRSYGYSSSPWWSSGRAVENVFLAFCTFKRQWATVWEFFSWVKWTRSGWFCLGCTKFLKFLLIAHDSSNITYLNSENGHVCWVLKIFTDNGALPSDQGNSRTVWKILDGVAGPFHTPWVHCFSDTSVLELRWTLGILKSKP